MYAVIRTGGKQYRVANGDVIAVEKLTGEAGADITFDEVLMIGDDGTQTIGTPLVEGATVSATVVEQTRGDKIIVFKKKRRKRYRRLAGHRQDLTMVRITGVGAKKKRAAPRRARKKADDDTGDGAPPAAAATPRTRRTRAKADSPDAAAAKPAAPKRARRKPVKSEAPAAKDDAKPNDDEA